MLFHYFKAIQKFNVPFSILTGVFSQALVVPGMQRFFITFWASLFTGGFLLSLFLYEFRSKPQYYFYYNKGLSRTVLIVCSYLLQLPFVVIYLLIKNAMEG